MRVPANVFRGLLVLYFVISLASTIDSTIGFVREQHAFTIGDWLINYRGGFVRRGLLGEILFQLGVGPSGVAVLHVMLYGALCVVSYLLVARYAEPASMLFILVSPALFLYHVYGPASGFRKEILFFPLLALASYAARAWPPAWRRRLLLASLSVYPLLILSHEMLAVFLPLLLIPNRDLIFESRQSVVVCGVLGVANVIAFMAATAHPGDTSTVIAICGSLDGFCQDEPARNGAISFLSVDLETSLDMVRSRIEERGYLGKYSILILLTCIAFVPLRSRLRAIFSDPFSLAMLAICLLGSLAVMAVAVDWGRIVYVLAMAMVFVTFVPIDETERAAPPQPRGLEIDWKLGILALIYAITWRLPHGRGRTTSDFVQWLL